MVDFNNDGMLGTNRGHILDLIVLQRRDDFITSYEEYEYNRLQNSSDTPQRFYRLKSRLLSLFLELDRVIERRLKNKYEILKTDLANSTTIDEVMLVFSEINDLLDVLNITKIDTKKQIDYTNIEDVNASRGF